MEKYSENSEIESIYVNCLPNRWKPVDKKLAESQPPLTKVSGL